MDTTSAAPAPIAPGLFADDLAELATVRLLGAREAASGRVVFPLPAPLPEGWEAVELPREGRLWSFTVQRFRPKTPPYVGPEDFAPYAVGYVELPGAVIVESRLAGIAFEALRIGMPLRLTTETVTGPAGTPRTTFAFTAAGEPA